MTEGETTTNIPEKVLRQVQENREAELAGTMTVDRDGSAYVHFLGGLDASITYAKTLTRGTWLDIGAGTTRGINDLACGDLGEGLRVEATVLNHGAGVDEYLGREKTYVTPVETLEGIQDGSVSLANGLNSVAYSTVPSLAVKSIDRVLESGGVFQGTFQDPDMNHTAVPMGPYDEFATAFQEHGYDTAIAKHPDPNTGVYILIAVKPGAYVTAQELLERNLQSLPPFSTEEQQAHEIQIKRGLGLVLDLLPRDASQAQIAKFVDDILVAEYRFSPEDAKEVMRQ